MLCAKNTFHEYVVLQGKLSPQQLAKVCDAYLAPKKSKSRDELSSVSVTEGLKLCTTVSLELHIHCLHDGSLDSLSTRLMDELELQVWLRDGERFVNNTIGTSEE